jgi:type VI secretion system secreted protein Hcp
MGPIPCKREFDGERLASAAVVSVKTRSRRRKSVSVVRLPESWLTSAREFPGGSAWPGIPQQGKSNNIEERKMAIYVEFEGVKGNVTAEGYKDHIAVDSVTFNANRQISMEPGHMTNREATRPSVNAISISKKADISVTALFKEAMGGSTGKKVVIKFVQTGSDKVQEFMDYTLENCLISGYSMIAGAESQPTETIQLSFSKILVNYRDADAANKSTSPQRTGYDLAAAKLL